MFGAYDPRAAGRALPESGPGRYAGPALFLRPPRRYGDAEDEAAFHQQISAGFHEQPFGEGPSVAGFPTDANAAGGYADWLQDRGRPHTAGMLRENAERIGPAGGTAAGGFRRVPREGGWSGSAEFSPTHGFHMGVVHGQGGLGWDAHRHDPIAARELADGLKSEGVDFDDRNIPSVHDYHPGMQPPGHGADAVDHNAPAGRSARNARYRRGPGRYSCGPEYTGYGPGMPGMGQPPMYQDPFVELCDAFSQLALAFSELEAGCGPC